MADIDEIISSVYHAAIMHCQCIPAIIMVVFYSYIAHFISMCNNTFYSIKMYSTHTMPGCSSYKIKHYRHYIASTLELTLGF